MSLSELPRPKQDASSVARNIAFSPALPEAAFRSLGEATSDALWGRSYDDLEKLYNAINWRLSNPVLQKTVRLRLEGNQKMVDCGVVSLYKVKIAERAGNKGFERNDTGLMLASDELMAGKGLGSFDTFCQLTTDAIVAHHTDDMQVAHDQLRRLSFSAYPKVSELAEGMMDVVSFALERATGGQEEHART